MEKMGRQMFDGYQMQSLIEFLLGDGTRPGWLDKRRWSMFNDFGAFRASLQQAWPEKNVPQEKAKTYYEWYEKARVQKQIVLGREKDLESLKEEYGGGRTEWFDANRCHELGYFGQ